MNDIQKSLQDLRETVYNLSVFDLLLTSIVVLMTSYAIFSLFNLFALISAPLVMIAFLFYAFRNAKRRRKLDVVESKYVSLREKLTTAADTVQSSSPVVKSLHDDVAKEIRGVESSTFLSIKDVIFKLILIGLIGFLIVHIHAINFEILDSREAFTELTYAVGEIDFSKLPFLSDNVNDTDEQDENNGTSGDKNIGSGLGGNRSNLDIYGQRSVAQLNTDKLDVSISTNTFEVNIYDEGELDQKLFEEVFPTEVSAVGAGTYDQTFDEDEKDLIKNYLSSAVS